LDEARTLRDRALSGEPVLGCLVSDATPWLAEMAALAGFDFVTLDLEHEPVTDENAAAFVRTCEAAGVPPVVRVPFGHRIQRLLNCGAAGIQVPGMNSAAAVRELVRETRFHPVGRRGYTVSTRSALYGREADDQAYFRSANERLFVIAMIEDIAAVGELDEILAVEGIDAFHIGPGDLAQSMGFPPRDEVTAVVDEIIGRAVAAGRVIGAGAYAGTSPESLARQRADGVSMFTVVLNRMLARYLADLQSAVRGALSADAG
jgi:2-keto-3-deoxy-L-rhamnonate aldolase RhmA